MNEYILTAGRDDGAVFFGYCDSADEARAFCRAGGYDWVELEKRDFAFEVEMARVRGYLTAILNGECFTSAAGDAR